jgi:hypothetical protein
MAANKWLLLGKSKNKKKSGKYCSHILVKSAKKMGQTSNIRAINGLNFGCFLGF